MKPVTWVARLDDGDFMTECRVCRRPRTAERAAAPKRRFKTHAEATEYRMEHEASEAHRKQVGRARDTSPTAEERLLNKIFNTPEREPCPSCGQFHKRAVGCTTPLFSGQ